jgi:cell division protein FtsQ
MDLAKKMKKGRRLKWSVAAGALLAVLVTAGTVAAAYEYLYIREIHFYGNRHLSADDLKSMMGCSEKSSFFSVSAGEIYRRLRKSPWIKDALVRKDLTGRIDVHVTESVAIGVLELNDKSWLIDREGVRLEEIIKQQSYFLPVIRTDPDLNIDAYHEAVILAGVLHDKKALAKSGNTVISGARPEDITVRVDDLTVKIGAGAFPEKLEKLNFARDEIARRNMKVEYVDIRFADRIVVKPLKDSAHDEAHKKDASAPEKAPDREVKKTREVNKKGEVKKKSALKKKSESKAKRGDGAKKRIGGKVKKHVG